MRKLLAVMACLGLFAAVANADNTSILFYFSLQGDTSGVPAEYDAGVNPTIDCTVPEYAYLWAFITATSPSTKYNSVGMCFDCDECMNQVAMSGEAYNPWDYITEQYRWETSSDFDPSDGCIGLAGVSGTLMLGATTDPLLVQGDGGRHYLVGEFDCLENCCPGDIYMRESTQGIVVSGTSTPPINDLIYFGFDPEGAWDLHGNSGSFDTCSPYPDLYCIPEPASLLLLGLAGLFLRRR